ncbi:MAG TPA: alkaline phosphatase family protein [Candidatus Brocadiales bacterium]|nr:alkaline phosphatase family protein [Candidatus Brocadiales bacterium]
MLKEILINMGWFDKISKKKKVVVLGLDGTPYSLIDGLIRQGELPNFSSLLSNGSMVKMKSVHPPVSSVAWTSFMTGKNPAKHGIFGFTDRQPDSYEIYFPNSKNIMSETLWDILGVNDKRSVVINVPSTYPAKELNGVLISGFVAIDIARAAYPLSIVTKLKEMGYKIDVDTQLAKESKDKLFDDLYKTIERRREALIHFFEKEAWDLFVGVITETDRLHHFFWEDMEKKNGYGTRFIEYYRLIDEILGQILQRVDDNTTLIIISDHGFCTLKKEVHVNHWLKENGFLRFKSEQPKSIADMCEDSKAYCLDPGRIYINLKGREPKGVIVEGREYEEIRDCLIEKLLNLRDTESQDKMILAVHKREDIYKGPYCHKSPDLVLESRNGYDLKGAVNKNTLTGKGLLNGMHTYDNALFYINKKGLNGNNLNIMDVAPTILSLLGVKPPVDMDGAIKI